MQKLRFKEQALQRFLQFILDYDCPVLLSHFDESIFDNTYVYIVSLRGSNGLTSEQKREALAEKFGTYFIK